MIVTKHISVNKHEYNVRQMEKLNKKILEKEKEILSSKGFLKTIKLERELSNLLRKLAEHGTETLIYERQRAENNNFSYWCSFIFLKNKKGLIVLSLLIDWSVLWFYFLVEFIYIFIWVYFVKYKFYIGSEIQNFLANFGTVI